MVIRVRAILSWNVPVDCANPNHVPVWGNREETLINVAPVASEPAGKIAILGGIPVSMIDSGTGLTKPNAVFATNNLPPDNPDGILATPDGRGCPFAGRVTLQGAPIKDFTYKVEVRPVGGSVSTPVVTDLILTRLDGTTYTHSADPTTLCFKYRLFNENINSVLAEWDTTGDTKWFVTLSVYDTANNLVGTDTRMIQLDNTKPETTVSISIGAGDCGKFSVGTVLSGIFVARDTHFGVYSLNVEPAINPAGVGVPIPKLGISETASTGDAWSLDTAGMKPCGYVLRVVARDLAIVNSQSVGHYSHDSVGFCLEEQLE